MSPSSVPSAALTSCPSSQPTPFPTYLPGHPTLDPSVSPTIPIDECMTVVFNGGFESGATGFTSSYLYVTGTQYPAAVWGISPNANQKHIYWSGLPHSGSLFMTVNGAQGSNVVAWQQTVTVRPDQKYYFAAWASNLITVDPTNGQPVAIAVLKFYIDGVQIGPNFSPLPPNSQTASINKWYQFYVEWISPSSSTTAVIAIVNDNHQFDG